MIRKEPAASVERRSDSLRQIVSDIELIWSPFKIRAINASKAPKALLEDPLRRSVEAELDECLKTSGNAPNGLQKELGIFTLPKSWKLVRLLYSCTSICNILTHIQIWADRTFVPDLQSDSVVQIPIHHDNLGAIRAHALRPVH